MESKSFLANLNDYALGQFVALETLQSGVSNLNEEKLKILEKEIERFGNPNHYIPLASSIILLKRIAREIELREISNEIFNNIDEFKDEQTQNYVHVNLFLPLLPFVSILSEYTKLELNYLFSQENKFIQSVQKIHPSNLAAIHGVREYLQEFPMSDLYNSFFYEKENLSDFEKNVVQLNIFLGHTDLKMIIYFFKKIKESNIGISNGKYIKIKNEMELKNNFCGICFYNDIFLKNMNTITLNKVESFYLELNYSFNKIKQIRTGNTQRKLPDGIANSTCWNEGGFFSGKKTDPKKLELISNFIAIDAAIEKRLPVEKILTLLKILYYWTLDFSGNGLLCLEKGDGQEERLVGRLSYFKAFAKNMLNKYSNTFDTKYHEISQGISIPTFPAFYYDGQNPAQFISLKFLSECRQIIVSLNSNLTLEKAIQNANILNPSCEENNFQMDSASGYILKIVKNDQDNRFLVEISRNEELEGHINITDALIWSFHIIKIIFNQEALKSKTAPIEDDSSSDSYSNWGVKKSIFTNPAEELLLQYSLLNQMEYCVQNTEDIIYITPNIIRN